MSDNTWEITTKQLKAANKVYISLEECREIKATLYDAVDSCQLAYQIFDSVQNNFKKQLAIQQSAILEKDNVLLEVVKVDEKQRKEIKKLNRANNFYKTTTGILIVTIVFLIIL